MLWSHIHCSSFLVLSHSVMPVYSTSLRARARHHTPGWQLLPSLLMLSAIHDKRYEMGIWWLKSLCSLVLRGFTFDRLWNCISKARHVVFPLFPLKPVIMMSPTYQPDDGWIEQRCTVTFITETTWRPRETYKDILIHWKNAGMQDGSMSHPVSNRIVRVHRALLPKCTTKPVTFTFPVKLFCSMTQPDHSP